MQQELTQTQVEALYEIRRKGGLDAVEIVDAEAVDAAREALGGALQVKHGLPEAAIESMSLETLAAPFASEIEAADSEALTETLASPASQHPETGGQDGTEAGADADDDPENAVEALSNDDRERVEELVTLCDRHEDRLPQHVAEWESEALMLTGTDDLDDVRADLAEY